MDWEEASREMSPILLRECPAWITSHRRLSGTSHMWNRNLPPVDINTLSPKQKCAYDVIATHNAQFQSGNARPPLQMIGIRYSWYRKILPHQLLRDTCVLTGTTGMASFNICGTTLHHLPAEDAYPPMPSCVDQALTFHQ